MDSDNDSYHFIKSQTHAYTRFENGCSENSTQNCLQSTLRKKIINTLFAGLGRSVLGKTVPSVLGTALSLRPRAVLKTSGTVFPNTDRPSSANNIYVFTKFEECRLDRRRSVNFSNFSYICLQLVFSRRCFYPA